MADQRPAGAADRFFAVGTDRFTALAERIATHVAGPVTVFTHRFATGLAAPRVTVGQRLVTPRAMIAQPIAERHIWTAGVVGLEDLPHDQKRVVQPSRMERPPERGLGVTDAERRATDVRMADVVVPAGTIGFLGHDPQFPVLVE